MKVELDHKEWTQVISALAAVHPLIAKISSQLASQSTIRDPGNGYARSETYEESQYSKKAASMGTHPRERGTTGVQHRPRDSDGERGPEAPDRGEER